MPKNTRYILTIYYKYASTETGGGAQLLVTHIYCNDVPARKISLGTTAL